MNTYRLRPVAFLSLAAAGLLAACGGGGSDAGGEPAFVTPVPISGNANASITATDAAATEIAALAKKGVVTIDRARTYPEFQRSCFNGNTPTVTNSYTGSTPAAGDTNTITQTDCTSGATINGTSVTTGTFSGKIVYTYRSFTNDQNFERRFEVTDASGNRGLTGQTVSFGPFTYTGNSVVTNGVQTTVFVVDGVVELGTPTVLQTQNTEFSAVVRTAWSGGGFVEIRFASVGYDAATGLPTSGTGTVLYGGGKTATISIAGGNYTITIDGTPFTVAVQ